MALDQKDTQRCVRISLFFQGFLYLAVFILGFWVSGFCVGSGVIGVISCILEFFGVRYNKANETNKKLFTAFTVLFFLAQIINHFLLVVVGVVFINLKKAVDTFVSYADIYASADSYKSVFFNSPTDIWGVVGVICVVVGIFVIPFTILAIIHTGLVFFVKVFISTFSIIGILVAVLTFIVLVFGGAGFFGAIPGLILFSCAVLGLVMVFKKNRKNVKCVSVCYAVFTALLSILALIVLVVLLYLRSFVPSMMSQMCSYPSIAADPQADVCADIEEGLRYLFCGEDLGQCEWTFDMDLFFDVMTAVLIAVLNVLIVGVLYIFLSYILPSIFTCILGCVEKREPAILSAELRQPLHQPLQPMPEQQLLPQPPTDPYNEAGVPIYMQGVEGIQAGFSAQYGPNGVYEPSRPDPHGYYAYQPFGHPYTGAYAAAPYPHQAQPSQQQLLQPQSQPQPQPQPQPQLTQLPQPVQWYPPPQTAQSGPAQQQPQPQPQPQSHPRPLPQPQLQPQLEQHSYWGPHYVPPRRDQLDQNYHQ